MKTSMKMQCITQTALDATMTILAGQTPVILATGDYSDYVGAIINFLRSGCPIVQFYSAMKSVDWTDEDGRDAVKDLQDFISRLALPGETFSVTIDNETVLSFRREMK